MIALIASLIASACPTGGTEAESLPSGKPIIDCAIPFDSEREQLMLDYRCKHQGECKSLAIEPKVIILHHTATKTFTQAWNTFAQTEIDKTRKNLATAGDVNVSAHFLVDRDGTVYRLMPENRMARHAIGLNHLAIGIENVGGVDDAPLTKEQMRANVELVRHLKKRHPAIAWLVGHHESARLESVPEVWLEKDPAYRNEKPDPGPEFMKDVRERVADLGLQGPPKVKKVKPRSGR